MAPDPLHLRRIAGPTEPLAADALSVREPAATLGRSAVCDLHLPDPSVSRQHARVQRRDDGWYLADLASTTGTFIDGLRLEPRLPTRLVPGADLVIGPWTFRVGIGELTDRRETSLRVPTMLGSQSARAVAPSRRLDALSRLIDELVHAEDEAAIATAALRSTLDGAGFTRGAVLRCVGDGAAPSGVDELEAVATLDRSDHHGRPAGADFCVSSNLVQLAASGRTAALDDDGDRRLVTAQSVADLGIHSAVCVPVRVDRRVAALLYLDARRGETRVGDAGAFCEDVAQLLGLALAYAARAEQSKRQAAMHAELERARDLRAMLTPQQRLETGAYRVVHRTLAGLFVSGDLFDVIEPTDGGPPVLLFGDATGHGVGAAMLTSLVHAYLHALIVGGADLPEALARTNRFIVDRPGGAGFVSLVAAALGPGGEIAYIDAGHGHWRVLGPGGAARAEGRAGAPPLGVDPDAAFRVEQIVLDEGCRLVLYTDGVIEQRDETGAEIGADGLAAALAGSASAEADVAAAASRLLEHAAGAGLDDDATIASIERFG